MRSLQNLHGSKPASMALNYVFVFFFLTAFIIGLAKLIFMGDTQVFNLMVTASFDSALQWAKEGKGNDKHGYRDEFIRLIYRAISLGF